jgi:hypothetical protein
MTSPRTRLVRTLLAVGLAIASLGGVLGAGPSAAATFYKTDPSADLVSYDNSDNEHPPPTAAPGQSDGDIVKIKSVHSTSSVAVKIFFRDLWKSGDLRYHLFEIATNEGRTYYAQVKVTPPSWSGAGSLFRAAPHYYVSGCHIRHSIDYTADTLVISVPRVCLSDPAWVKLGFLDQVDDGDVTWVDDARRTGYTGSYYTGVPCAPGTCPTPTLGGRTYPG